MYVHIYMVYINSITIVYTRKDCIIYTFPDICVRRQKLYRQLAVRGMYIADNYKSTCVCLQMHQLVCSSLHHPLHRMILGERPPYCSHTRESHPQETRKRLLPYLTTLTVCFRTPLLSRCYGDYLDWEILLQCILSIQRNQSILQCACNTQRIDSL